jgi:hypothetical protein
MLPLPERRACKEIWEHPKTSLTMAVKAPRLLQPAKGTNEAKGKGYCCTAKHKEAQRGDTGNSSVVIPPEMME